MSTDNGADWTTFRDDFPAFVFPAALKALTTRPMTRDAGGVLAHCGFELQSWALGNAFGSKPPVESFFAGNRPAEPIEGGEPETIHGIVDQPADRRQHIGPVLTGNQDRPPDVPDEQSKRERVAEGQDPDEPYTPDPKDLPVDAPDTLQAGQRTGVTDSGKAKAQEKVEAQTARAKKGAKGTKGDKAGPGRDLHNDSDAAKGPHDDDIHGQVEGQPVTDAANPDGVVHTDDGEKETSASYTRMPKPGPASRGQVASRTPGKTGDAVREAEGHVMGTEEDSAKLQKALHEPSDRDPAGLSAGTDASQAVPDRDFDQSPATHALRAKATIDQVHRSFPDAGPILTDDEAIAMLTSQGEGKNTQNLVAGMPPINWQAALKLAVWMAKTALTILAA